MNYILIFPDEMRAESLHCYGNPDAITPNMDRLAAEGTRFTECYTAHPVCTASRCSIVTGCYPHVHGFRSLKHYLTENDSTFVREMRTQGMDTVFSGKADCWQVSGTKDAFSTLDPNFSYRFFDLNGLKGYAQMLEKNPPQYEKPYDYTMLYPPVPDEKIGEDEDTKITDFICSEIRSRGKSPEKPYFMMVSLNAPHPPYVTYEKYTRLYDPEKLTIKRDLKWLENKPEFYRLTRKYRELEDRDSVLFKKIYATYLARITFVDDLVGRIISALEEAGSYDDTMIVLCSDHGDFAGDAGLVEKWPNGADDMLTRVPLIMKCPGGRKGHTVGTPVQSIDIFPTIFDVAGLTVDHPQFGVSLKAEIQGSAGDETRYVYTEGGYDTSEMHAFEGTPLFCMHNYPGAVYYPKMRQQQERPESACRMIMQRDRKYKLILRTDGENELYDMEEDPLEYRNLYFDKTYAAVREEKERILLNWLMHTSDVTPYEGHRFPED